MKETKEQIYNSIYEWSKQHNIDKRLLLQLQKDLTNRKSYFCSIKRFFKNTNLFDFSAYLEIEKIFKSGHDLKTMIKVSNPQYNYNKLYEIRECLESGISFDRIEEYLIFSGLELTLILSGIKKGYKKEQINLFARKDFDSNQMTQIKHGINQGLSIAQMSSFAKPEYSWKKMFDMRLLQEKELI